MYVCTVPILSSPSSPKKEKWQIHARYTTFMAGPKSLPTKVVNFASHKLRMHPSPLLNPLLRTAAFLSQLLIDLSGGT